MKSTGTRVMRKETPQKFWNEWTNRMILTVLQGCTKMKTSGAAEHMHTILSFFSILLFATSVITIRKAHPILCCFIYIYIYISQRILCSTRYVITSCKERFITLASAKLILHDGIVDKALSLKLIRKLIIKELVESSEFILFRRIQWDDSSLARLHSYRLYIALLQCFKCTLVG